MHRHRTLYLRIVALACFFVIVECGMADPSTNWLQQGLIKLPAGVEILSGDFPAHGDLAEGPAARLTWVNTSDPRVGKAARIETLRPTTNVWDVHFGLASGARVNSGDVGVVVLAARTPATAGGNAAAKLEVRLQRRAAPYEALGEDVLRLSSEWQRFYVPFQAADNYAPGEILFAVFLGFGQQTVELGPAIVLNFGPGVSLDDLPANRITYGGREPDAPWRAEAAARIERLRKGDLTIRVLSPDGSPAAGVRVRATLTRHDFWFGNAVKASLLLEDSPNGQQYRMWVKKLFNIVCFENDMKWGPWEGAWGKTFGREQTLRAIDWLAANAIPLRGHTTVWADMDCNPADIPKIADDEALRRRIREHVTQYTTQLAGRVTIYDLHSEPISQPLFSDRLGMDEVVHWFNLAHKIDPKPLLFVNEFGIVSRNNPAKMNAFKKYVRYLLDAGAPISGVSPQCHLSSDLPSMTELKQRLDDLATLGLPIYPDQWEPIIRDEACQGDYTRDFYTMLFSHPNAVGISQWGFWEGQMWKPSAAWFRKDWTIKPSGQAYIDLVLGKWKTDETGVTDADGIWKVRGFTGAYEVFVGSAEKAASASAPASASLTREGTSVTLRLPSAAHSKSPVNPAGIE